VSATVGASTSASRTRHRANSRERSAQQRPQSRRLQRPRTNPSDVTRRRFSGPVWHHPRERESDLCPSKTREAVARGGREGADGPPSREGAPESVRLPRAGVGSALATSGGPGATLTTWQRRRTAWVARGQASSLVPTKAPDRSAPVNRLRRFPFGDGNHPARQRRGYEGASPRRGKQSSEAVGQRASERVRSEPGGTSGPVASPSRPPQVPRHRSDTPGRAWRTATAVVRGRPRSGEGPRPPQPCCPSRDRQTHDSPG
jgi:hypothetical protein